MATTMGIKLKTLREARGWSREELARRAKLSRMHVWKIETGRSDPTVGVVRRLAKALRVSVTRLLR